MGRSLTVGKHTITDESDCYVIAEIGVNHNGDYDRASAHRLAGSASASASRLDRSASGYLFPLAQLNRSTRSSLVT